MSAQLMASAQSIADVVDYILLHNLGLFPPAQYGVGSWKGRTAVVASLDPMQIGKNLAAYENPDVARRLSQALDNLPVVYLPSKMQYVISLSGKPKFPARVDLPTDPKPGVVYLGARHTRQTVAQPWSRLGHIMVAGKTGSGKSNGLRLIAYQAMRDNFLIAIADNDMVTFPMLAQSPSLLAPIASTPQSAMELAERIYAECEARASLYQAMPGYPESLEEYNRLALEHGKPIRPLLLVLDEISNTIIRLAGKGRKFTDLLGALGMRTRKFGLWVVFAAHEFTKEQIGLIRPQCETALVYRNEAKEMSALMGCAGAENIKQSAVGRMVTNKWGRLQTFFLDKARLGNGGQAQGQPIPESLALLVKRSLAEEGGKMTTDLLMKWGLGQGEARRLCDQLELRGWLKQDPSRGNARFVTPILVDLATNRQTLQTPTNQYIGRQTADKPTQTQNMEGAIA